MHCISAAPTDHTGIGVLTSSGMIRSILAGIATAKVSILEMISPACFRQDCFLFVLLMGTYIFSSFCSCIASLYLHDCRLKIKFNRPTSGICINWNGEGEGRKWMEKWMGRKIGDGKNKFH